MDAHQFPTTPGSKTALYTYIDRVYHSPNDHIPRDDFFHQIWNAIGSLVRYNRHDPLVKKAVQDCSYFSVRSYVLLTVLHGSFSHEPRLVSVLKDTVDLLDKDLIEKEMQFCAYARNARTPFLSGLFETWQLIQSVHRGQYFSLTVLPPTAYHSYVLYTLHNQAAIGKKTSQEEVFGTLSVMHAKMGKTLSIAHGSQVTVRREP